MIRLKISKHGDSHILLEALEGISHFGFGTFLLNLQPAEIQADVFSRDVIINAKYKQGLQGMEIWPDNRIAWGSPDHKIIMPIKEISKIDGAENWLKRIVIIPQQ